MMEGCRKLSMKLSLIVLLVAASFSSVGRLDGASGPQKPELRPAVPIFASADESSVVIELNPAGNSLAPIAEMTGAGGSKWFMVKTKAGNVGWIKADTTAEVKKIDDHFRALPRDTVSVTPASGTAPSNSTTAVAGAMKIPVKIHGAQVLVPVNFQNGSSTAGGYLILDTGAMQTMVSKRMARDLRLLSSDSQIRIGISGSMVADVGVVELVQVGSASVKNMRVTIHDLPSGSQGLLGYDFLGRFQMSIDSEKQEMTLSPRKQ